MTTTDLSISLKSQPSWIEPLMEFVDGFRRAPSAALVSAPVVTGESRLDALVAAAVETLCDNAGLVHPEWTRDVQPADQPWLVSEVESIRGIAFAESPAPFRRRRVFVLKNFLSRA